MKKLTLLILSLALVSGALLAGCPAATDNGTDQIIENIGAQAAFDLIQQNQGNADFFILDVRTPEEFAQGHVDGAINIDFFASTFEAELLTRDTGKTYFIYCRSGNRSGQARDLMEGLGFTEVYNLTGGFNAWQDAGLPTVTD